jgi:hypothetical protein
MKPALDPPRLLLSVRSLNGVSLATRDRMIEVLARYREPESLAVTLSKAISSGADGVLGSPTPVYCGALEALRELGQRVPTFVVVPTLAEHERCQLVPGVESILARPGGQTGFAARMQLGFDGLLRPAAFYRGSLIARLPLLIASEVARLPARDVRGVVLDAWLTDLALAAGHRRFFESYCRLVRGRFGAAGLETHNVGMLLNRLGEWGIRPDLVVGPLNPNGVQMKPSPQEALEELDRSKVHFIAKELRAGGVVSLEEGARFAHEQGADGLAPDLTEFEDVGTELKATWARLSATAGAVGA